jgi:hypothetical protein
VDGRKVGIDLGRRSRGPRWRGHALECKRIPHQGKAKRAKYEET